MQGKVGIIYCYNSAVKCYTINHKITLQSTIRSGSRFGVINNSSRLSCAAEHPGGVSLWLGPHPESNGKPDTIGGRSGIGQSVRPSHRGGCRRQGGPQRRVSRGLQRKPSQGDRFTSSLLLLPVTMTYYLFLVT